MYLEIKDFVRFMDPWRAEIWKIWSQMIPWTKLSHMINQLNFLSDFGGDKIMVILDFDVRCGRKEVNKIIGKFEQASIKNSDAVMRRDY